MNDKDKTLFLELKEEVLQQMDLTLEFEDEQVLEVIDDILKSASLRHGLSLNRRCILRQELFYSIRKLDALQELLEDPEITEIMINGTNGIFIEKHGALISCEKDSFYQEKLEDLVQKITGMSNRIINEASPLADARLEDGSRVHLAIAPVALNGPIITIRRFPQNPVTIDELLDYGSLSKEIAEFLKKMVVAKYNIFVSGSTGSGKTTLLNVLSEFIPKQERIITIEDTAELQIQNVPNLVRLESRASTVEGCQEISIRDLLRASLRMRPDRIIVGEVRGAETIDMLQAFNTGHQGSLSTGHGNSTRDMLFRLETMVLMGMDFPISAIRRQISSGIDLMIHLGRLRDKRRVLLEIAEIDGYEDGMIVLNQLYRFQETGISSDGKILGAFVRTGRVHHREKLSMAGFDDE